jgi:hypothetical protein
MSDLSIRRKDKKSEKHRSDYEYIPEIKEVAL